MNRIKELRKARKMTQNQLCAILKIAQPTLSGYENETSEPDNEMQCKIADYFGVTVDYLLGREETRKDPVIQNEVDFAGMDLYPIPLLGRVVAGVPIESQENLEGYVFINHKPKEEYFALRVFGDSMINAGIPDGAILIVHKQPHAENGNIVIAFLNGEQTVKYLKFSEEDMYLVPANNNYLPIHIKRTDEFLILGKVVEIRINL